MSKYQKSTLIKSQIESEVQSLTSVTLRVKTQKSLVKSLSVMGKYNRRQVSHRHNALKRGYIIMEDCSEQGGERYNIYYDNETKRSPIFERNLLKDGFQLKQWSE